MEHNRRSTKSVPFFVAPVSEPEFGQDLVRWGTCIVRLPEATTVETFVAVVGPTADEGAPHA